MFFTCNLQVVAMIRLKSIYSLSEFQRKTKQHVARMKRTHEPEVLTVNGQAELVVMSVEAFEKLRSDLEREEIVNTANGAALESLRRGEIAVEDFLSSLRPRPEHRGIPVKEAFAELDRRIERRRKKKAS
jgi:prevent-host-death family protein